MRVRLAKPLNFETAHGIFTKFHKKSQKTLPDIDNKAGYTATPVACGWAGAVFEVTWSLGQEQ